MPSHENTFSLHNTSLAQEPGMRMTPILLDRSIAFFSYLRKLWHALEVGAYESLVCDVILAERKEQGSLCRILGGEGGKRGGRVVEYSALQ